MKARTGQKVKGGRQDGPSESRKSRPAEAAGETKSRRGEETPGVRARTTKAGKGQAKVNEGRSAPVDDKRPQAARTTGREQVTPKGKVEKETGGAGSASRAYESANTKKGAGSTSADPTDDQNLPWEVRRARAREELHRPPQASTASKPPDPIRGKEPKNANSECIIND